MSEVSAEGRRALILMLEHGVLTRGRKGFYPGFSTTSLHRPIMGRSLQPLQREGWVERDELSGRMRLTDRGRIAAEHERSHQRQLINASYPRRFSSAPAKQPKPAAAPVAKARLPYADD